MLATKSKASLEGRSNVWSLLVKAQDLETNSGLTMEEIRAETTTLVVAGK